LNSGRSHCEIQLMFWANFSTIQGWKNSGEKIGLFPRAPRLLKIRSENFYVKRRKSEKKNYLFFNSKLPCFLEEFFIHSPDFVLGFDLKIWDPRFLGHYSTPAPTVSFPKLKKKLANFLKKERCIIESIIFIFLFISLFFKVDYFPVSKTISSVILQTPYLSIKEIGTPDGRE